MTIGPGVSTGKAAPCVGCGNMTVVKVNGVAGHWICIGQRTAKMRLAFLEELRDNYAPKRRHDKKMMAPYWAPPLPQVTDLVRTSAWTWQLPKVPSNGRHATLDRTAAFLSSAASVDVAWGALIHTPDEAVYRGIPGFYKVRIEPWYETHVPHPLGGAVPLTIAQGTGEVWVPHTRVQLLQRLAGQGRYPDGFIVDSYTAWRDDDGKPAVVRLNKWAEHVQKVRTAVLAQHGRDTGHYDAVKVNFSQAIELMSGSWTPGQGRQFKPNVRVRRPDWAFAIEDLSATTLWGWADDIHQVVTDLGRPELGAVAMQSIDEIVIPFETLDLITTTPRAGGRKPMVIDPDGVALGTFKVKGIE